MLHIDAPGERVLLADGEGCFYWKPLAECKFIKAAPPDVPRPVVQVTLQPQPSGVVIPRLNGNGRRN